jgi:methylglyoxal synthase
MVAFAKREKNALKIFLLYNKGNKRIREQNKTGFAPRELLAGPCMC